jgi:ubiquinone/menaquinone biosynthesis C-methylase UbiE
MDATDVFALKAYKYARYRWDYCPQAIETILKVTGVSSQSSVADIGAGTGILTKHFLGRVRRVYAVEPNAQMRRQAETSLGAQPSCTIVDGRAEATTLPDHSIDLIAVAQAIHWFEPRATRTEFWRILQPGGWLALIRNYGTDSQEREAVDQVFSDENGFNRAAWSARPERKPVGFFYGTEDYSRHVYPFATHRTWDQFIGSLSTASTAPDEGDPRYARFMRAAREVFERLAPGGVLESHVETELCLGRIVRS